MSVFNKSSQNRRPRVAIVWRGDAEVRRTATPQNNRFKRIFEELEAAGISARPVVFDEDFADSVREQLLATDGVLVWVNPLQDGKSRHLLNAMLEEVAAKGPWVSAHPGVIDLMGTKEILFRTRHFGWGTDTNLYRSYTQLRDEFPAALSAKGPRVLKQARGNDGHGVWKVELVAPAARNVRVVEASDGVYSETSLDRFLTQCEAYFEQDGFIVDQPFQDRVIDGMVRCYVAGDRIAGFAHQYPKGLLPPDHRRPHAEKRMFGPDEKAFAKLRQQVENEWVPQMMAKLGIDKSSMPVIWDADFLYGLRTSAGQDTYILCEINVSSVFAIPDEAPREIARVAAGRLGLSL